MGAGRPSKYKEDMDEQVFRLASLGLTNPQICIALNISHATLDNWNKEHTDFRDSIQAGKKVADEKVIESLYRKACGYSHPDAHITNYQGIITETPIIKHYPPDTGACVFWLKNRQGWRDVYRTEHTGEGGGPIVLKNKIDLSDFSDEELKLMVKMGGMKLIEANGKGNNGADRGVKS